MFLQEAFSIYQTHGDQLLLNIILKVPLFTAERDFVDALLAIGERMRTLATKELKSK